MTTLRQIQKQAQNEACSLLSTYTGGVPTDVETIAKSLQVKIVERPLEEEISGFLLVKDSSVTIAVNKNHHLNRRRFTIAHELGHYQLHRNDARFFVDASPVFFRGNGSTATSREQEQSANAFAAALLMPENAIRREFDNAPFDIFDDSAIRKMADRFQVSPQALSIRLYELDLVVYSPGTA